MKTVFRFWSKTDNNRSGDVPDFREPTLSARRRQWVATPSIPARLKAQPRDFSIPRVISPRPADANRVTSISSPSRNHHSERPQMVERTRTPAPAIPIDQNAYAKHMDALKKLIALRPSPFNTLVEASERLSGFIPSEIDRLQAAWSMHKEQWPPETVSAAIHEHIADIAQARMRGRSEGNQAAAGRDRLASQLQSLSEEEKRIEEQLRKLVAERERVRRAREKIQQEMQAIPDPATGAAFLDQAAENLTRDLLAKKAILGLP